MTDINADAYSERSGTGGEPAAKPSPGTDAHDIDRLFWFVEAFFFAYRDFVGDPDRMLGEIGFGRAHHRVLHFVCRYPGMRVADLLEILQITKQSLARVLRELIREGYIVQRSAETDRRARLLYVTARGRALTQRLAQSQLARVSAALSRLDAGGREAVARFLTDMATDGGMLAGAKPAGDGGGAAKPFGRKTEAEPSGKR